MKIAAGDKREGGSGTARRGEERRIDKNGGKLICLGDGMSQGREEKKKKKG